MSFVSQTVGRPAEDVVLKHCSWDLIAVSELRAAYQVPMSFDDRVLYGSLQRVASEVDADLVDWFAAWADQARHPWPAEANDQLPTVYWYRHAVYARAMHHMYEHWISMARRDSAETDARDASESKDYWLGESTTAIKRLKAMLPGGAQRRPTANVELL